MHSVYNSGVARMTESPGHCMGMHSCTVPGGSTSFLAIRKGSRTIFMHFNIAFELDSGLLLAAAVAEGAQQSNEARLTNYNDL